MKLYFILLICVAVFYIGYCFSIYYKKKLTIYCDLIKLCEILQSEIKFNKNTIHQIILNNLNSFSNEFKQFLINYYINNNNDYNLIYLNSSEIKTIKNFFDSLGKYDVEGEIAQIKNQQTILALKKDEVEIKNQKIGQLGTKLGVLCALLVFIVLV